MNSEALDIRSPKRVRGKRGWEGFFPYYAGFPDSFASSIISSARLNSGATVLDPWNGSGTTTFAASRLGFNSVGIDINPVMAIVARARLLNPTEADSLLPLAHEIVSKAKTTTTVCQSDDPLLQWFDVPSGSLLRSLETHARRLLVGQPKLGFARDDLRRISSLASSFYVALFAVAREMLKVFQSSNPTWTRIPKDSEAKVSLERGEIMSRFLKQVEDMADALGGEGFVFYPYPERSSVFVGDTVNPLLQPQTIDFVLTSPPYCTRIDYAAATRVELSLLHDFLGESEVALSRKMLGSTRVTKELIAINEAWGHTATTFLQNLRKHPSKASAGYYLKTHLDYFSKLDVSIQNVASVLKKGSTAVFVVQDSYYKELHNDLPRAISELASRHGLVLKREERFEVRNTLATKHPHSRRYRHKSRPTEAVLCFEKVNR